MLQDELSLGAVCGRHKWQEIPWTNVNYLDSVCPQAEAHRCPSMGTDSIAMLVIVGR